MIENLPCAPTLYGVLFFITTTYNLQHINITENFVGLPCSEVQKFEKKHKIYRFDIDHILDSITFCESIGYSKEDLIKHPSLLKTHPLTLDQYHRVLTECGFQNVSPKILTR